MKPQGLGRRSFLKGMATAAAGASLVRPFEAAAEVLTLSSEARRFRGASGASVRMLKERYMLSESVRYFNHASIGTIPRAVHEARVEYLRLCEENPWLYMWGGAWEGAREDARSALGAHLGSSPDRMMISHNTTEAFSLLAGGLPLGAGDEVLFTSLNHDGASVAFEAWGPRRGYSVRRAAFPVSDAAALTEDDIVRLHLEAIRPETQLLVVPHIDNMVGIRVPLPRLAREARAAGVRWIAVDGAQTAGMIPLSLDASGVDAYAGSGHKWLQGPKGTGFCYLSPEIQAELQPLWMTWGQRNWAGSVRRFEDYGTRNLAEALSLTDAVEFQEMLDAEEKQIRLRAVHARLQDRVESSPRLRWRSPRRWEDGGSLVAVEVLGASAVEVGRFLSASQGVILRTFGNADLNTLRLAPHVITTDEEIEQLLVALEEYPE